MKEKIHPKYVDATITCACGEVIHTRSTKKEIRVGVCSKCHPFFTGTQKYLDTAGRVEKFIKKYAGAKVVKKKTRKRGEQQAAPAAAQEPAPEQAKAAIEPSPSPAQAEPVAEGASSAAPPEAQEGQGPAASGMTEGA